MISGIKWMSIILFCLQAGAVPAHRPSAWQVRLCSPTTWYPCWQEYVVRAPNNFPFAVTLPKAICSGSGHSRSIAKLGKNYVCIIRWFMSWVEHTWFNTRHATGPIAKALFFLTLAVFVRWTFPQTFLTLNNNVRNHLFARVLCRFWKRMATKLVWNV